MPFKKKGKYYYSPSGKRYTKKQVDDYHNRKRSKPKPRKRRVKRRKKR
ncbi:MAG: hypothetical protein ACYS30_22855 [Planctomycetota bacterium]|jgi:ribosomal protein L44E